MGVGETFSYELQEVIAKSRDIALALGYDYISTLHFFMADCESEREDSILNFAFRSVTEYEDFKKHYFLEGKDYLDLINDSLPLTVEAEITLRMSETERVLQDHNLVYASHLFIAALKNETSTFAACFKHDKNALTDLIAFYRYFDEKKNVGKEQVYEKIEEPKKKNKLGCIDRIKKLLKLLLIC